MSTKSKNRGCRLVFGERHKTYMVMHWSHVVCFVQINSTSVEGFCKRYNGEFLGACKAA
jgi:hypothetical protein